jgi:hypothetical protein
MGNQDDYVICPKGYEAVSGGAWPGGQMSYPYVNGAAPADSVSGPAATGWFTRVVTGLPPNIAEPVQWYAVCAKVGA